MKIIKLWQKLAIGFLTASVVAVIVSYFLVNVVIDVRVQRYVGDRERASYEMMGQNLASIHMKDEEWDSSLTRALPEFSVTNGVAVKVADARGDVVAETVTAERKESFIKRVTTVFGENRFIEDMLQEEVEVPIIRGGNKLGTVYITPLVEADQALEDEQFIQSVNRSLLFGGILATLVALTLSFIISARLTRPLARVTHAAKALEDGDLGQRVNIANRDEIGELGRAFNHMAEALQDHERIRKNMTADVAHELRTPLATIRSHIEAYRDGVLEPDAGNLESIHEEIMRLGRLVNDLRELAQAESGKLALNREETDLSILATQVVGSLKPMFEERQIEYEIIGDGQIIGDFDEDRIKQVLVNLLINAVNYSSAGDKVTVKVGAEDDMPTIQVIDTGEGIDEQSLPRVFDRLYRVDKSRNRATGGSGIGLTIAQELVKLHGGTIDVTSKIGVGSTFTVKLPKKSLNS